jgi:hypothetical protein
VTNTVPRYGDPADWDAIPVDLSAAIQQQLEQLGWQTLDAHDDAIVIDVPGLGEYDEWCLARPGWRGDWWAYGIYTRGHCPNPQHLDADPTDPAAIAVAVDKVLRAN